ncbi:MAG: restriction endonuclease [bacterium]
MANLKNSEITEIIIEKFRENPNLIGDLGELIAETYIKREHMPKDQACEEAECKKETIKSLLLQYIETSANKKIKPYIEFNSANDRLKGVGMVNEKISLRPTILNYLKGIDPYLFEALCPVILKHFGVADFEITKKSNDGGIDFVGQLNIQVGSNSSTMLYDWDIKIIGQAKRYSGTVGRPDMDKFLGVAIRNRNQEKTFIPILFMFVTTGGFSKDAYHYAKEYKIITKDGDQIAEIILQQDMGIRKYGNEWEFDETEFVKHLCNK